MQEEKGEKGAQNKTDKQQGAEAGANDTRTLARKKKHTRSQGPCMSFFLFIY
jgi:hypothetical protein